MASLYANENFPQPVVEELRRLGHDVLTVLETGKAGQSWPDEAFFEFAISQRRAVLTINRRHFFRLHRSNPNHAGIIACTYDLITDPGTGAIVATAAVTQRVIVFQVQPAITLPGGVVKTGTLDENGSVRVEEIPAGTCKVSFPDLDQDAWVPAETAT